MPQRVAGDFNCLSGDLDVTPNALGRRRTGYLGGFQLVEETYGLTDGTSTLERDPSHIFVPHTALEHGLTDGFYNLTCCTLRSSQRYGRGCQDTLRLQAPSDSCNGPPSWTFPLQLLYDGTYAEELKNLVKLTEKHRQISPGQPPHPRQPPWESVSSTDFGGLLLLSFRP